MTGAKARPSTSRSRRTFRLTREGKVFLSVTLGVGVAAVNTGNNMLYLVLGLMLSLLLTSGVLSDLVLLGLVVRRLPLPRMHAGQASLVELEVGNRKRFLPSLALELVDVTEQGVVSGTGFVLRLEPRATTRVLVPVLPPRRGALSFARVVLRTRYPFGLLEKGQSFALVQEAVVYPRIHPVALPRDETLRAGDERPSHRRGTGELVGLREARGGEPMREVHFRRSAALGRLVVRERADEASPEVRIGLDAAHAARDALGFEAAVEHAASLAAAGSAEGRRLVLVEGDVELVRADDPRDVDRVLHALAFVAPRAEAAS